MSHIKRGRLLPFPLGHKIGLPFGSSFKGQCCRSTSGVTAEDRSKASVSGDVPTSVVVEDKSRGTDLLFLIQPLPE